MVEVLLVRRHERTRAAAAVQPRLEEDGGVGAAAEVQACRRGSRGSLPPFEVVGGVAGGVLRVAVAYAGAERAGVGCVGAGVVLDVAGAADGGGAADEGVAVDREGSLTACVEHGGRETAEITGEGLHVGSDGCGTVVVRRGWDERSVSTLV